MTVNLSPVAISIVSNVNQSTLVGVTSPTPAGAGNNIVIGGIGDDTIDIGGTNNTVLGDDGQAIYDQHGPDHVDCLYRLRLRRQ